MTNDTRQAVTRDVDPMVGLTKGRRRRIVRNLTIYIAGVMTLSVAGGIVLGNGAEVGALLFLIGPLLMSLLLRTFGGDGWRDAGLRLGPMRWYPFALLIFPVTFGLILGVGALTGTITVTATIGVLLAAAALEVGPRLIFAGFEEWGWRGYFEPRLAELGVPDLKRHVLVGVVWAVWHIPYILTFTGYSNISAPAFVPLLVLAVIAMAVVYGQLRQASGSVWPVVLAHGVGNILAFPLVFGDRAEFTHPALLATRPESLLFIAIWVGIGWIMLRRSRKVRTDAARQSPTATTTTGS